MPSGLEPTETTDEDIAVLILSDGGRRDRIRCHSFASAIETVKDNQDPHLVTKIENRDGEIVFTSDEMDIEDWESEWQKAKARFGVEVEEYDCPYGNVGCLADDLCVQCKMDRVQDDVRGNR